MKPCDWQMSCRTRAVWIVCVGSRRIDRQRSCNRHLAVTCKAMFEAENRATATLAVMPAKQEEQK